MVLIGFSLAAPANTAIEAASEPADRALLIHAGSDLGTVTGSEPSPLRGRYWITAVVHDVAWGGIVIAPDESIISASRFRNLANVEVRVEEYDPTLPPEAVDSLNQLPSIRGVGNLKGNGDFVPFSVVSSREGTPIPVLRIWFYEERVLLIDDRVDVAGVSQ